MNIYLLTRHDAVGYDEYDAKVILAHSEDYARELANQRVGDEGNIWDNRKIVSCEEISLNGEARVILGSFNAG